MSRRGRYRGISLQIFSTVNGLTTRCCPGGHYCRSIYSIIMLSFSVRVLSRRHATRASESTTTVLRWTSPLPPETAVKRQLFLDEAWRDRVAIVQVSYHSSSCKSARSKILPKDVTHSARRADRCRSELVTEKPLIVYIPPPMELQGYYRVSA